MAQNISLWGASYSDVPAVDLPKSGGGTATFTDTTPTTATASDVSQGKYFFTAQGILTLGTNQGGGGGSVTQDENGYIILPPTGGGGGGLEYEEGTYSPNADTASVEVLFSNVHTTAPFYCVIQDADASTLTVDAMVYWAVINLRDLYGAVQADNVQVYGRVQYSRRTSSGQTAGGSNLTTSSGVDAVLTSAKFAALNTSAYFRSSRTYTWIAVWKP